MDVTIRNISSRGLGLQSAAPPPRGAYVEIYRLRHRIIGRVVWCEGLRFGIYTRERMQVDAVISEQPMPRQVPGEPPAERRAAPREPATSSSAADIMVRLERSRRTAAALNFGAITCGGAAAALLLASTAAQTIAAPMQKISHHLQASASEGQARGRLPGRSSAEKAAGRTIVQ